MAADDSSEDESLCDVCGLDLIRPLIERSPQLIQCELCNRSIHRECFPGKCKLSKLYYVFIFFNFNILFPHSNYQNGFREDEEG